MDLPESERSDPLKRSAPKGEPQSASELQKAVRTIVCHVKPTLWWMVYLGILEAGFMFSSPFIPDDQHPGQNKLALALIAWPVGLIMATSIIWVALELLRGEISADEAGLRWRRGLGGWKSARWDEISDFYQTGRGSKNSRMVATPSGKLTLSSSFEGIDRIAELVVEKAVHTGNHGWEVQGMRRRQDWSRTLPVWSSEQKWTAPSFTGLMVVGLLDFGALMRLSPQPQRPRVALGFWLDIFPLFIAFALFAPMIGLVMWTITMLWRDRKFAWDHRDETLRLDARGLVFGSHAKSVEAKWDEVRAISSLPTEEGRQPIEIETTQGDFVIWSHHNTGTWRDFKPILAKYSPWVMEHYDEAERARALIESDLEGAKGAWSGGEVGVGARRWGFRSRATRFTFQCASPIIVFLPFLQQILAYNAASPDVDVPPTVSWPLFTTLLLISATIVIAGWLWYRGSDVLADNEGLHVRSPFHRPRRASWDSIVGVGRDFWGDFVRTPGGKLYFSRFFPPVRIEELRNHIEQKIEENRHRR